MKANQKFRSEDEAVSPVIAVILMVAITVVLAATVYVWVSGFGAQSGNPSKTLSMTSSSALTGGIKTYTISSGTSGMRWSDLTFLVNGVARTFDAGAATCPSTPSATTTYLACAGTTIESSSNNVMTAGKTVAFSGVNAGDTLRVKDATANSIILTLTIG